MSEKKPFGIKETVKYEFDYNELVPGDVYLIKTKSMPEPRFAIHESASEVYANFLIPDNTAVASDRYRTIIGIDELLDGSSTIERVLSYSEYTKPRKCGYCKNYKKCNYHYIGCSISWDNPACSDFEPIK